MAKAKLHDDWERLGTLGLGYELVVGPDEAVVIVKAESGDDRSPKRDQRYRLDKVYAQLLRDVYERGKKNLTLW
jgi:hypothetical protein